MCFHHLAHNYQGLHGLAGWRWLFIVEGAATAGWSIVASFILMDFPASTKRLSESERELAIRRLRLNDGRLETEDTPELSHLQALKLALANWRLWLFVVGYMAIVGASTMSYFYPTLVAGLGYDAVYAQYSTSKFSDTSRRRNISNPSWRDIDCSCILIQLNQSSRLSLVKRA